MKINKTHTFSPEKGIVGDGIHDYTYTIWIIEPNFSIRPVQAVPLRLLQHNYDGTSYQSDDWFVFETRTYYSSGVVDWKSYTQFVFDSREAAVEYLEGEKKKLEEERQNIDSKLYKIGAITN